MGHRRFNRHDEVRIMPPHDIPSLAWKRGLILARRSDGKYQLWTEDGYVRHLWPNWLVYRGPANKAEWQTIIMRGPV